MKTKISTFIAVALMSSTSFAQSQTSTMPMPKSHMSSQGIRLGFVRPTLDMVIKMSGYGESSTVDLDLEDGLGVSVGYAYLPIQELGWTANLVHAGVEVGSSTLQVTRLDGNAALALNEYFNVKGGLNLSRVSGEGKLGDIAPALGIQAGVGAQITENFGVDLNYVQMNQSGTVSDIDVSMQESGFELGVNGTF